MELFVANDSKLVFPQINSEAFVEASGVDLQEQESARDDAELFLHDAHIYAKLRLDLAERVDALLSREFGDRLVTEVVRSSVLGPHLRILTEQDEWYGIYPKPDGEPEFDFGYIFSDTEISQHAEHIVGVSSLLDVIRQKLEPIKTPLYFLYQNLKANNVVLQNYSLSFSSTEIRAVPKIDNGKTVKVISKCEGLGLSFPSDELFIINDGHEKHFASAPDIEALLTV